MRSLCWICLAKALLFMWVTIPNGSAGGSAGFETQTVSLLSLENGLIWSQDVDGFGG